MGEIRNICILGSTGSIGRNSLDVIASLPDRFRVVGLSANRNIGLLKSQIETFRPDVVAVRDARAAAELRTRVNGSPHILIGEEGLSDIVSHPDVDTVISALVGFAGLRPTIAALMRGKTVALANKETLVVAGEIIIPLARKHNARLVPIDSEHSAIQQCITGEDPGHILRLILTASGGPFLQLPREEFARVTVKDALRHPNWRMGNKITIDSATLMNKGLEVIEARWLFGLPAEKIDVLIHPQSIIHSMVEFIDGSVKAQLGVPDMKIPIQYALTGPERVTASFPRIDFAGLRQMTFFHPDPEKFRCLPLAYQALRTGGTAPTILNAANEIAVERFLNGTITFDRIPELIGRALERTPVRSSPTLDDILETDREVRSSLAANEPVSPLTE